MSEIVEANGHAIDVSVLRDRLIRWGRKHRRSFPWRETNDPYRILVAEFMLLRTQAPQVLPVYTRFVKRFPDLKTLAKASREEVHEILYPLGLRWRADYVYETVAEISDRFNGVVPHEKSDLLSLPGVSQYIAGAVRCFGLGKAEPLIDTNTVRVTGRLFGLMIKDSSRRSRLFRRLIASLLDLDRPRDYNYSLLDLAAEICSKKRPPDCPRCPLLEMCIFGQTREGQE